MKLFCSICDDLTEQIAIVNSLATQCYECGNQMSRFNQAQTEANTYTAPDGNKGILVKNNKDVAIFSVTEGEYKGLYVYDKKTGFGAVQNR